MNQDFINITMCRTEKMSSDCYEYEETESSTSWVRKEDVGYMGKHDVEKKRKTAENSEHNSNSDLKDVDKV